MNHRVKLQQCLSATTSPYFIAVIACFAVGFCFTLMTLWLGQTVPIADALSRTEPSGLIGAIINSTAGGNAELQEAAPSLGKMSAFMVFRGYAALNLVVCIITIGLSLSAVWHFVQKKRTRLILIAVLLLAMGGAAILDLAVGSGIQKAAGAIICRKQPLPHHFWDFCSEGFRVAQWTLNRSDFTSWANALVSAATGAVVYAIFVVSSTRFDHPTSAAHAHLEAGVTLLLIAASVLLLSVLLSDRGYLHWAFAEALMSEHPVKAINAYIAAASAFNGAVQTALLGMTWFLSVIMLQRATQETGSLFPTKLVTSSNLSLYKLSAVFAPIVSAIVSNLIGH